MSAFALTRTASLLSSPELFFDQSVTVAGWLTSARFSKRVGFLVLSDGSRQEALQVVVPFEVLEATHGLRSVGAGVSVRVQGTLVASKGAGQAYELLASSVELVGMVDDPQTYPIQPKAHTPEFLRTVPHLRHRVSRFGAVARVRHRAARAIHDFFEEQGFLWVATPILTASDAEGAGARFRVTAEDAGAPGEEFFGDPAYLTVSGQLTGEALCAALSRVYTFGPTFRAERSQTSRHLAEFWMVEPEMAFATLSDLAQLSEGLLKHVVRACLTQCSQEMASFAAEGGRSLAQWEQFLREPFERMTYTAAVRLLEQLPGPFTYPVSWGVDLQSEHERALVSHVGKPVVLTDYPADIKAFYMKASSDGQTVAALDVLVPGMGEIIGGSVREESLEALDARMLGLGMDLSAYSAYRDLRRYGSVPHGGFGLGFERLVAYLAGLSSIKDAIAYPRAMGSMVE